MKSIITIFLVACFFQNGQSQSKVDQILSTNTDDFEIVMEVLNSMPEDFESLNQFQKNIYYVVRFEGTLAEGGFYHYFFGHTGQFAHETLVALKEIKAHYPAKILKNAIDVFPKSNIPRDTKVRRDFISHSLASSEGEWEILKTELYQNNNNLDRLMVQYITHNKDKFE